MLKFWNKLDGHAKPMLMLGGAVWCIAFAAAVMCGASAIHAFTIANLSAAGLFAVLSFVNITRIGR